MESELRSCSRGESFTTWNLVCSVKIHSMYQLFACQCSAERSLGTAQCCEACPGDGGGSLWRGLGVPGGCWGAAGAGALQSACYLPWGMPSWVLHCPFRAFPWASHASWQGSCLISELIQDNSLISSVPRWLVSVLL